MVISAIIVLYLVFLFSLTAVIRTASAYSVRTPAQIEDYIIYKSQMEGVNATMALAIARAESNFNPIAKNPKSTASGVYQFLDGTFKTYCIDKFHMAETMEQKNHPATQIRCAIEILIQPLGYRHWLASASVWRPASL